MDLSPEQIKAITDQLTKMGFSVNDIGKFLSSLSSVSSAVFTSMSDKIEIVNGLLKNAGVNVQAFSDVIKSGNIVDAFYKMGEGFDSFLTSSVAGMDHFGSKSLLMLDNFLGILPESKGVFSEIGVAGVGASKSISESISDLGPLIKNLPGLDKILNLTKAADEAKKLELGILEAAAASGTLDDVLRVAGPGLSAMSEQTASFAEMTSNVSKATGAAIPEVSEFALALGKEVPDALNTLIHAQGGTIDSMNMLEATMKVSSAYGISSADMVTTLSKLYKELGTTGTDAVSVIARIGAASQDLRIPLEIVKTHTEGVITQFKMMGDNTQSAINMLDTLSASLSDSGLGPRAVQELTKGVIDGIAKMDQATKAFVSSVSGGPGGLAGAFEIDLLIRDGNLDEVAGMIDKALMKEFGRVVTLEDVREDRGLAPELQRQVAYLTDVMKVANSQESAYRLLEGLQKGEGGDALGQTRDPNEALVDSINTGTDIQKSQLTVAQVAENHLKTLVQMQAIQNWEVLKDTIGTGGGIESAVSKLIDEHMSTASADAQKTGAITVADGTGKTTLNDLISGFGDELFGGFRIAQAGGRDAITFMEGLKSELGKDVKKAEPPRLEAPPATPARRMLAPVPADAQRNERDGVNVPRGEIDGTLRLELHLMDNMREVAKKEVALRFSDFEKGKKSTMVLGIGNQGGD